jgi:hypothetical protein
MPSHAVALTISREELLDVASDAECLFKVFTVLTGRAGNDLCGRLDDLVIKIVQLVEPFETREALDDEARLRGSEKAIAWLDELADDEREWLKRLRGERDDA